MIQAMFNQPCTALERAMNQIVSRRAADFAEVLGSAGEEACASPKIAAPAAEAKTSPAESLGDPGVQGWLDSYYAQMKAANPYFGTGGVDATTSYEPAAGAASHYQADSVYGPDQIYAQALSNQVGNAFSTLTGGDASAVTSELPGIPSQAAQQLYDKMLAHQNALRLESGQPIDTAAYWADPGPLTIHGHTYTSEQLGYAGPAQSSGPQPIYISQAHQVAGTDTFTVPGYTGTVQGIQPGRYYTLEQLEKAGLPAGQPDAQIHPGSWTLSKNS